MRMTNLRALRERRGLTRERLATLADISMKTIEAHEYGRTNDVSMSVASSLAGALDVAIDELFLTPTTGARIASGAS
jgi:DNA-binding XRE family transcriptional regulator